jgi:hypothetical protein
MNKRRLKICPKYSFLLDTNGMGEGDISCPNHCIHKQNLKSLSEFRVIAQTKITMPGQNQTLIQRHAGSVGSLPLWNLCHLLEILLLLLAKWNTRKEENARRIEGFCGCIRDSCLFRYGVPCKFRNVCVTKRAVIINTCYWIHKSVFFLGKEFVLAYSRWKISLILGGFKSCNCLYDFSSLSTNKLTY